MLLQLFSVFLAALPKPATVQADPCGGVEGIYICNPHNPTLFDICIGDQKYTMSCPSGLQFNSHTQTCDWPQNADCGKQNSVSQVVTQGYKQLETNPFARPSNQDADVEETSHDSDYLLAASQTANSSNGDYNGFRQRGDGSNQALRAPHTSDPRYKLFLSQTTANQEEDDNDKREVIASRGRERWYKMQSEWRTTSGPGQNPYLMKGARGERHRQEMLQQKFQANRARNSRIASDGYDRFSRIASDGYDRFSNSAAARKGKASSKRRQTLANGSNFNNDHHLNLVDNDNNHRQEDSKTNNDVTFRNTDSNNDKNSKDRFSLAHFPWWASKSSTPLALRQRFVQPTPRSPHSRTGRRRQVPVSSAAAASRREPDQAAQGLAPSYQPAAAPRPQPSAHIPLQQPLSAKSITAAAASAPKRSKKPPKTGKCSSDTCKLPDCHCVGTDIPGKIPVDSTPQMIMLTFDDSVNVGNFDYYTQLFDGKFRNPNGCPIKGTFFVSGDATQYHFVEKLSKRGQEIASHSISHRSPTTYWAHAGYDGYVNEIEGMRKKLSEQSNVPRGDITGMRVPFLQVGGDDQYQMLEDFGYRYDTSMVTGNLYRNDDPPIWPFTLDYPPDSKTCSLTPCPTKSYPGLWEVPLVRWYGSNRLACAMPDGCTIGAGKQGTISFLEDNFNRHYESNRSPVGIFLHASWFRRKDGNLEGLMKFLENMSQKKDVWVVSVSQVLDWIQNPVPNKMAGSISSWSCS